MSTVIDQSVKSSCVISLEEFRKKKKKTYHAIIIRVDPTRQDQIPQLLQPPSEIRTLRPIA